MTFRGYYVSAGVGGAHRKGTVRRAHLRVWWDDNRAWVLWLAAMVALIFVASVVTTWYWVDQLQDAVYIPPVTTIGPR